MESILQQLFGILITPPGNLIYHLTLAFSVFACLQVALINRRNGMISSGRALLGLNLILIAQLALFLSSGLAWQGVINPHIFLPVFDRAVIFFSIIWIGWLWAFPRASRPADILAGLFSLGAAILFLYTFTTWSREGPGIPFNGSWQDALWSIACLALIILSIFLVLFRRPENWGLGFGMMLLLLAGVLAQLFLVSGTADFSGYLRVAQLAAFPLLPGLLLRFASPPEPKMVEPAEQAQTNAPSASSGMRAVHAWMDLNLKTDPDEVCAGVAQAVAQTMMADLCYVVSAPADSLSPVALQCGYDLVREEVVTGSYLDQSRIPAIANALVKGKPLRLTAGETVPPDIKGLSETLGLEDAGNLLVIPLLYNNVPWGGLLLLSPYSHRVWTLDDASYLASETDVITQVLRRSQGQAEQQMALDRMKEGQASFTREIDRLRQENQHLSAEMNALRQSAAERAPTGNTADLEGLLALQRESQDAIANLQIENARLRNELQSNGAEHGTSAELPQMEKELRATLGEVAHLQNLLANSNIRSLELERKLSQSASSHAEDPEVIASIVQELRQPMSSVMGYTDLLLAESVGILGALQKKFLERVRAATERLRGLMDDLIQITAMSSGPLEMVHQPIDLSLVIDTAINDISARLREKNINMRVEIPNQLPLLHTDRDALQQVVGHLLQNASLATPAGGTIILRTGMHREEMRDFLILQVTDEGGGISSEDFSRVFERRYRADNVLLQGVGDTGVGLSISRTLVEAMGGRIWVESEPGKTSTFSVLLPTRQGVARETAKP